MREIIKNGKIQRSIYLTKELDELLIKRSKLTLRTISAEIESLIKRGLAAQYQADLEAVNMLNKFKNTTPGVEEN